MYSVQAVYRERFVVWHVVIDQIDRANDGKLGLSWSSYISVMWLTSICSAPAMCTTASIGDGGLQSDKQCKDGGNGNGLPIREPFHANPP